MLAAGDPRTLLATGLFVPLAGWPAGVWTAHESLSTRLVVIPQLPAEDTTLVLRLMGKGAVYERALAELRDPRWPVPEREAILAILVQSELYRRRRDRNLQDPTRGHEMVDLTLYNEWKREMIQDGELKTLALQFGLRLKRKLTEAECAVLRRHVETHGIEHMSGVVLEVPTEELAAWITPRDAE